MRLPPIPEIPPELAAAVGALCIAAESLRIAFRLVAEGHDVANIVREQCFHLTWSDAVIRAWCEHIDFDPASRT
jgi:hypothetical protein